MLFWRHLVLQMEKHCYDWPTSDVGSYVPCWFLCQCLSIFFMKHPALSLMWGLGDGCYSCSLWAPSENIISAPVMIEKATETQGFIRKGAENKSKDIAMAPPTLTALRSLGPLPGKQWIRVGNGSEKGSEGNGGHEGAPAWRRALRRGHAEPG